MFAPSEVIRHYQDIREHEIDLWQTIEDYNYEGRSFKEIKLLFKVGEKLRMTRTSVAQTKKFAFSSWNKENVFNTNEYEVRENKNLLEMYKNDHENSLEYVSYGQQTNPIISLIDQDVYKVYEELLSKFKFPNKARLPKNLIKKIFDMLSESGLEPRVDVRWMRYGGKSMHDIEEGKIPNYMVGQRPKGVPSNKTVYKGDRCLRVGDKLELQIHYIVDRNTGKESPTLALYIPSNYMEKLTKIVERDEII